MKDQQFIKATKAWLKTHELAIETSVLNISFYNKKIALLQKSVAAELNELSAKREMKESVLEGLKKAESK